MGATTSGPDPIVTVTRTPDSAFADLVDYPFEPHYLELGDELRMHYVDEGDPSAAPVLLLHGEPTWSYLYRHMIPALAEAEHRVIAPDLIGFGKSDKPSRRRDYSYQRHVDWLAEFVVTLDLRRVTLFCQDWGSLLGLRIAAEHEARFARIVVGNGALPLGHGGPGKLSRNGLAFLTWRTFATYSPIFPIGRIVNAGSLRELSEGERRAYDAPFTGGGSIAGARAFPALVPISPKDPAVPANRDAWEILGRWKRPLLTTFSDRDPIMHGGERAFQKHVPGAFGLDHTIVHGGHFLQEDSGPELAGLVNALIAST